MPKAKRSLEAAVNKSRATPANEMLSRETVCGRESAIRSRARQRRRPRSVHFSASASIPSKSKKGMLLPRAITRRHKSNARARAKSKGVDDQLAARISPLFDIALSICRSIVRDDRSLVSARPKRGTVLARPISAALPKSPRRGYALARPASHRARHERLHARALVANLATTRA